MRGDREQISEKNLRRRGVTLIEMLVTISIGSMVVGLIITMMNLVLTAQSQGEGRARQQLSLSRLNRRFREDLSRATGVDLFKKGEEVAGLTVWEGETEIRWSSVSQGVVREELKGGNPGAHEFLWLGAGSQSEWSWDQEHRAGGIQLRLPRRIRTENDIAAKVQEEVRDALTIRAIARSLGAATLNAIPTGGK